MCFLELSLNLKNLSLIHIYEMIVHAWYMVTEFNLKLGPCNTTDNLEEVVRYISTEYKLASTVEEGLSLIHICSNGILCIAVCGFCVDETCVLKIA